MRKNILVGKNMKSEKVRSSMFNRIIKKINAYQDIRIASIYLLKKVKKITKSKAIALIQNDNEVFCDYSKKQIKLLQRLYKNNKSRWNNYFNKGFNIIDCYADIRMHNYLDFKILKPGYLSNTILMRASDKKNYDDGVLLLKKIKNKEFIENLLPYIIDCFKAISLINPQKAKENKQISRVSFYKSIDQEKIQSRFLVNNTIEIIELKKFHKAMGIKDNDKISYIPYIFQKNTRIEENDILKMRHNNIVFFDLLFKYKNTKRWYRVEGTYSNIDESEVVYDGIFTDITILKREKLHINLNVINKNHGLGLRNEVCFEYIIYNDHLISYGNIFGKKSFEIPVHFFRFLKLVNRISIKNNEGLDKLKILLSGIETEPFEILFINNDGEETYYEIDGTVIFKFYKASRIIGKIKDITIRKRRELELISSSKLDITTEFYTFDAGYKVIKEIIDSNKSSSLLIIDIDDFDFIVGQYGKLFSNIVIKEASALIKSIFPNGILVRYHRDGFLIYLESIILSEAKAKADLLLEKAKEIYIESGGMSISVGIVDTDYSKDLDQLLITAEQTLLYSKRCGGDLVSSYNDIENSVRNNLIVQSKNDIDDEILVTSNTNDIIAFMLEILMKAKNFKVGLKILLCRLKDIYPFQKICVYEYNYINNEMKVNCDWKEYDDYQSEEEVFNVSLSELDLILNSIKDDELKLNPIILNKLNEKIMNYIIRNSSYRHFIYLYNKKVNKKYFINFCIPKYKQFWPQDFKRDMRIIANIILSFIMKEHDSTMVQVKTDYLSNMSHEIRTPLNGIIGMTKIAKNIIDDPKRLHDALDNIDMSSRYLLSLVNNILDMSRIESEKMKINKEPFILSHLLDDIETLMGVQADQKHINFQVIRKFSKRVIMGDTLRISQVIVNLLGNAFKFTAEYGHVLFFVSESIINENISLITFLIKDSGIGIKKENTIKIFESFEQGNSETARQFGGSGLGLSISNSLVKLMGGSLGFNSEEGKGSEFYFTLTLNHDMKNHINDFPVQDQDEDFIPSLSFIGKRVLLVEDDKLNCDIIKVLLENVGFKIEVAINGKEALEMFAKSKINYYDIILMDIRMPLIGGYEATTLIRSLGRLDSPEIPIIAMTANAFEDDISEAIKSGMNGYITKPIDIKVLYQELDKILKK